MDESLPASSLRSGLKRISGSKHTGMLKVCGKIENLIRFAVPNGNHEKWEIDPRIHSVFLNPPSSPGRTRGTRPLEETVVAFTCAVKAQKSQITSAASKLGPSNRKLSERLHRGHAQCRTIVRPPRAPSSRKRVRRELLWTPHFVSPLIASLQTAR